MPKHHTGALSGLQPAYPINGFAANISKKVYGNKDTLAFYTRQLAKAEPSLEREASPREPKPAPPPQNQTINMVCYKCGHKWTYKGTKEIARCPSRECNAENRIVRGKRRGE